MKKTMLLFIIIILAFIVSGCSRNKTITITVPKSLDEMSGLEIRKMTDPESYGFGNKQASWSLPTEDNIYYNPYFFGLVGNPRTPNDIKVEFNKTNPLCNYFKVKLDEASADNIIIGYPTEGTISFYREGYVVYDRDGIYDDSTIKVRINYSITHNQIDEIKYEFDFQGCPEPQYNKCSFSIYFM